MHYFLTNKEQDSENACIFQPLRKICRFTRHSPAEAKYRRGEVVFAERNRGEEMYVVKKGKVCTELGVSIAFGAELYTLVVHDSELAFGLSELIGGLVFCLGLTLVVIAGGLSTHFLRSAARAFPQEDSS